jgi:predicted nucleic acid-binding protein
MILVDSSVWVDYFNAYQSPESILLDGFLGQEIILIGDLILLEVLQGVRSDAHFESIRNSFAAFQQVNLLNTATALQAAQYDRNLRKKGITIRKTNDCIIATWCIVNQIALLQQDRDFGPFVENFGLRLIKAESMDG